MATVEIRYKCTCMVAEVEITTPERKPDEEITHWMEYCVTLSIYLDHRKRSPRCNRETMQYAKIKLPETTEARIGDADKLN